MIRRKYFFFCFVAALILLFNNLAVSAQVGQVYGEVVIQQADGRTVPAAGATINIYRTDILQRFQATTDRNGRFIYAALPFVGTYVIAASAPNAAPNALGGAKPGRDINYRITLSPGDGRRLTEAEAKAAAGGSNSQTSQDRKSEEARQKNAQIAAQNEKIIKNNETVARTFRAGNEAYQAGRYDEAIAQYNEGLAADPEQSALWTNKSLALRMRGVNRFNAALHSTDEATRKSGRESAAQDLREALEAASKAVDLIKKQSGPEQNKYAAITARAEVARILAKVDASAAGEDGFAAIQEYISIEPDEGKRMQAQLDAAQVLFDTGKFDRAAVEFRKLVSENSYNFDAFLGLGLSLYATGNKSDMAEAEKSLQRFVEIAPDTHPKKREVREILQYLKQQH